MPAISLEEIIAARGRIGSLIRPTPVLRAEVRTPSGPVTVAFKLEYLQLGGSFKIRGSLNAIVHAHEGGRLTDAGVVIASGGNAAIGAATACRMLDLRCTVVVPTTAPAVKVARLNAGEPPVATPDAELAAVLRHAVHDDANLWATTHAEALRLSVWEAVTRR